MRYVPLERIKDKMVLAQDVYTLRFGLIGKKQSLVDVNTLSKFYQEDINGIYVEEAATADVRVWPVLEPNARYQAMLALQKLDFDTIFNTADQIVNEISKQNSVSLEYTDIISIHDYGFAHNINMAITSCAIGVQMQLGKRQLRDLAIAALYCDIGMSRIDRNILNKDGRLTREEYAEMKRHVDQSYLMMSLRKDLTAEAKEAILHHHENEDGSGYPDGLYGDRISLYAKILHVADVYDAMISKRPFKKSYTANEALEYCLGGCGVLFDRKVVSALAKCLPRYQKGKDVILPGGVFATIFRNRKENDEAPLVKTERGQMIDLANVDYNWRTIPLRDGMDVSSMVASEMSRNEMIKVERRFKIMAVDDQATNLQVLREILEEDYDLVLLKSAEQAFKYLEKNEAPDLILMDINMPEMNGIDATRRIHKMTGNTVPVMFVSTNHDIKTVLECRGVGCAGFVMRPYNEVYIKMEVDKVLHGEEN